MGHQSGLVETIPFGVLADSCGVLLWKPITGMGALPTLPALQNYKELN